MMKIGNDMNDSNLFSAPIKALDHDLNLHLLETILNKAPRLLREGLFLAAVPYEYDVAFLAALRRRDDGRDERLAKRLVNYSFIRRLENGHYGMEAPEREFLQRCWLQEDKKAFRAAHERAVEFLAHHPDSDPITHTHNLIYHMLISDANRGTELFIKTFQAYVNEHFLAPADRLIDTAADAHPYITSESTMYSRASNDTLSGFWSDSNFDDLLLFCQARLSQLRGEWKKSRTILSHLEGKETLPKRLRPYVERAYGLALAHFALYVEATTLYHKALTHFSEQANSEIEQGHTLIMLGDAYVDLGMAARGYRERLPATTFVESWQQSIGYLSAFSPLPMMIYLAYHKLYFWHPSSWQVLLHQDWIIASLFAWGARSYNEADKLLESLQDKRLEWNRADQKLAQLYLRLGDPYQATQRFQALLKKEEGQYTGTLLKLGLASGTLQLGDVKQAEEQLQAILPVIKNYEDPILKAQVISLLAEVKLKQKHEQAIEYFAQALELYIKQEDVVAATEIAERLEGLVRDPTITTTENQAKMITNVADHLPFRQYQVRFQHPTLVNFRRLSLIFVGFLMFLLPWLAIRITVVNFLQLDTNFTIHPPLRGDNFEVIADPLFQSMANPSLQPNVFVWEIILMLLIYAVIYLVVGLILIVRTHLHSVQDATKSKTVRLNAQQITIGEENNARPIKWSDVTHLVTANVAWWQDPMPNNSVTIIATAHERLALGGATACYNEITKRISGYLDEDVLHIDLTYSFFRSPLGVLYMVSALLLLIFIISSTFSFKNLLNDDWFASAYSLIDLYPYFYVGLLLPPIWWAVGRPLINRARLKHHLPSAWFLFAGGLLFLLLHLSGWFAARNLPHIYLSLSSLLLFASVLIAFWQAKEATIPTAGASPHPQEGSLLFGHHVQPAASSDTSPLAQVRLALLTLLLLTLIFGLAADLLREVIGYHYLVVGSHKLTQVSQLEKEMVSTTQPSQLQSEHVRLLDEAIIAYSASWRNVPRHLAALRGRTAANAQLAVANKQLEKLEEALADYDERVRQLPDDSTLYSDRAIAYAIKSLTLSKQVKELSHQGQAERYAAQQLTEQTEQDRQRALEYIAQAIKLKDNDVELYWWRTLLPYSAEQSEDALKDAELYSWSSVLHYSAMEWEEALNDAKLASILDKSNIQGYLNQGLANFQLGQIEKNRATSTKDEESQQKATTYYQNAIKSFKEAQNKGHSSVDLQLAIGYAYYQSVEYEKALSTWSDVIEADPGPNTDHWLAFILRGTAYWRIATVEGNACNVATSSPAKKKEIVTKIGHAIKDFNAALALRPEDAFTYRTRAQFHYLLQNCPGHNAQQELRAAIDDYTLAIQHDIKNNTYWQLRARLQISLGRTFFIANEEAAALALLEEATADITQAYALQKSTKNQIWHDFITLGGQGWYHLRRGDAYAKAENYPAALADYEIAAQQIPLTNSTTAGDATEAAFSAGLTALRLDEIDLATEWYQEGITRAIAYKQQRHMRTAQVKLDTWIAMYAEEESAIANIRDALERALE